MNLVNIPLIARQRKADKALLQKELIDVY